MKVLKRFKLQPLRRYNLSILGAQVGVYAALVSIWTLVTMLIEHDINTIQESIRINALVLFLLLIVFMVNFYLLVPYFFEAKDRIKQWTFWIINLVFIILWDKQFFNIYNATLPSDTTRIGFYQFGVLWMILNYNPHFLFNTLNNIASLTQTSPANAQRAIGQLSELLRYTLYATQPKEVSLMGEIAFIKNYINLMRLRSGANVEITSQFTIQNSQLLIAPLLFLTPVENAFKHGISATNPSFIHISIIEEDGNIIFLSENSNYPKNATDKSGKGIGLENMYRRLELIYPRHYRIHQVIDRNIYRTKITITPFEH